MDSADGERVATATDIAAAAAPDDLDDIDRDESLSLGVLPVPSRSIRLFADQRAQPRRRRATDAVALGSTIFAVAFFAAAARPQPGFSRSIELFFRSLPLAMTALWEIAVDLPLVIAGVVILASLLTRRLAVCRDMLLAAVVAGIVGSGLVRITDGAWPDVVDGLRRAGDPSLFPIARLAIAGAILLTASPHLVSPARSVQHWVLGLAGVATVALGDAPPSGAVIGILLAIAVASVVHLAVGSSAGRPSLSDVELAASEVGIVVTELTEAHSQPAGVFVAHGRSADGAKLRFKVYGRDAHDTALLTTLWRNVWLREPGASRGVGRLRQVEHEAFLTLLAKQSGLITDAIVTAGFTGSNDALLIQRCVGRPFLDLGEQDRVEHVEQIWSVLATLHAAGISHGEVDAEHLIVHEGALGLSGFRSASVTSVGEAAVGDQVQALVTIALLDEPDRAIASAMDAIGPDALAATLPMLQPASLTPAQRRSVRSGELDLDLLRHSAAAAIGGDPPKLQKLRRFSVGSVLRIVLPLLTLYVIASAVANFDFDQIASEVAEAAWWIIAIAMIVAQLPRLAQAVSTLGASPIPLPLGPVYALQLSVSYINLAIPSTAARLAVNIRFFQRHGVSPGGALAAGGLDGFSGFIVQATILVSMLTLGSASLNLDLDIVDSGPSFRLLLYIAVFAAAAIAAVALVPRLRDFVMHWARQILSGAADALRGLRSPRRVAMLFGGNLAAELLFASALGLTARAFGADIGLGELMFINVAVALLSGLIPIPGGIGVTEGGLIYGLVMAGVDPEAAFAAVITYRIATFYLPPIWGFFALRWLERNQHL